MPRPKSIIGSRTLHVAILFTSDANGDVAAVDHASVEVRDVASEITRATLSETAMERERYTNKRPDVMT